MQVEIFHFKGAYARGWGKLVPQDGALINAARIVRHRGRHVRVHGGRHGARHHGAELVLGAGREGGSWRHLKDPQVRARLKKEIAAGSEHPDGPI